MRQYIWACAGHARDVPDMTMEPIRVAGIAFGEICPALSSTGVRTGPTFPELTLTRSTVEHKCTTYVEMYHRRNDAYLK